MCLLLAFTAATGVNAQGAVCAEVKIEIPQSVSLERQAFNAKLGIDNGTDAELQQFGVNVEFMDDAGNAVIGSSDPNNTTAKFFLRLDDTPGIVGGVDGAGVIGARVQAQANWLIIPAAGTGGTTAAGRIYYVGATITYTQAGEAKTVSVVPDTITVEPQPLLELDYFLPTDVYADDPFTAIVEPSEPFTLGVRIKNVGGGAARHTRIESAQPSIVENQQGLVIGFNIEGSFVQNQPAQPTLLLDFGQIDASSSKVGRWLMTTTLLGRFSAFNAEYTHDDALGGALTSLIDSVTPHELVKDVRVDLNGRDAVRDFLALDIGTYRTYESEGTDIQVVDRSQGASLANQPDNRYLLTFTPSTLSTFARVPDASHGTLRVAGAIRVADGSELPLENVWLSRSRQSGGSGTGFNYFLNLYDARGSGSYLIAFENAAQASVSGSVYRDLNSNGVREGNEPGIAACPVRLVGTVAGDAIDTSVITNAMGDYSFTSLQSSTYSLTVGDMPGLENGMHATGSAGGSITPTGITDVAVPAGGTLGGYLFAKRSTSPTPHADSTVVLNTLTPSVTINEEATVRITIENRGPDVASGTLNFTVDSGLTVVSVSAGQGTINNGLWSFGTLQVQAESMLTLVVRPTRAGTFGIAATLAAGSDPDITNNTGHLNITASTSGGDLSFEDGFESKAQASASPLVRMLGATLAQPTTPGTASSPIDGNSEHRLGSDPANTRDSSDSAPRPTQLMIDGFESNDAPQGVQ